MGGVGHFLFGSDKKGRSEKTDRLTPEQKKLLKNLSTLLSGQVGEGIEPYPGERAAGPSGLQQNLFDLLETTGAEPGLADQLSGWGREALTQDEQYDPEAAQEYWRQSFVEPARQNFFEETLPRIQEQFAGQGALSSGGFNRAAADAASRMNTDLAGQLADVTYRGKEDFLNRQFRERGLGLGVLDEILANLGGAGQTQRGIEQAGLAGEYQKWQEAQPWANPWLQHMPTALGTQPYQIDTYTKGGGTGMLGGLVGGIGRGIGGKMYSSKE